MSTETDPQTTDQPANEPAEGLGEAGRKALAAEREARKSAERQAKEATEKLAKLETADMRRRVATEKGLTEAQATRLQGDTEAELTADADALLDAFKADDEPPRRPRENLRPGAVPGAGQADSMGAVADRIARRW